MIIKNLPDQIFHQNYNRSIVILLITFLVTSGYSQTSSPTIIPSGSYIINMGIVPQTVNNGLRPYGLIYELLQAHCPVHWVINTSKAKDGVDFSYKGTDFRGGTFIIEAKYRTTLINNLLNSWAPADNTGVIGITTNSPVTVPLYLTFWDTPRWTLDKENGLIAVKFFEYAGIPSAAYGGSSSDNWKAPSQLGDCDDVYVMPHADPTWATHGHLFEWINGINHSGSKSSLWVGCIGGSTLMDMFNNVTPDLNQQTNFLVDKSGPAFGTGPYCENSLLLWGNHTNGNSPYSYDYSGEPVMQFMGTLDGAQQGGFEQIYIPSGGNEGWFANTHVGVYDPIHPQRYNLSNKKEYRAATLVYGPGMGIPGHGHVMLEGGHNIAANTAPANIAAQRAFFNFSFLMGWRKAFIPSINDLPDTVISTKSYKLSYAEAANVLPAPVQTYTTNWSASCNGTWSPDNTSINPIFTPAAVTTPTLCNITAEITDNCGRMTFDTHSTIIMPCTLTVTNSIIAPLCLGDTNGSIILNVNGGTAPFSWTCSRVDLPGVKSTGSGTTITGLPSGKYNYTVTNEAGCFSGVSDDILIKAKSDLPTAPEIVTITQPTCAVATGSVVLNGLPGSGSWTLTSTLGGITKTGTGVSTTISGLVTGTYSFTVTNAAGCNSGPSANIVINTQPVTSAIPTIGTIIQPTCTVATGSVNITGLPDSGLWTLTRTPGGGSLTGTGTNLFIPGLASGTYTYTLTNTAGCSTSASANVVINEQPAIPLAPTLGAITNPVCAGATGTIMVTAPTGTGTTYSIDGLNYTNTTGVITQVASGVYSVTAKSVGGCVSLGSVVTINSAPPILVLTKAEVTNPILCNGATASVTLVAGGGTSPLSYTFNGVKNSSGIFNGVPAGTALGYTITDGNQCGPVSGVINVTQPQSILLTIEAVNVTCKGAANGSINLTVMNGTTPYTYAWTGPGTFAATKKDLIGLSGGTYNVTVTDANGCVKTISAKVEESLVPLSLATTSKSAIHKLSINGKNTIEVAGGSIDLTVSGGTAPMNYTWTGPEAFMANSEDITDLAAGIYKITVLDGYRCTASTSVELKEQVIFSEDPNCVVSVPNAFSPNGDGAHDYFKIKCLYNYENPRLEIFNRWGNLLFKKDHYGDVDFWGSEADAWWDGRSENKLTIGDQGLPVGTYFYLLRLNGTTELKGFLFLNK